MANGTSGLVSQMNSIERIIAFVIVLVISGGSGVSVARYVQSKPVAIENIATKQDVKDVIIVLKADVAKIEDNLKSQIKTNAELYRKNSELIWENGRQVQENGRQIAELTGYIKAKSEK